jgi:hypothetical protein
MGRSIDNTQQVPIAAKVRSLEDELAELKKQVNWKDFEYVPVPRTPDEDE